MNKTTTFKKIKSNYAFKARWVKKKRKRLFFRNLFFETNKVFMTKVNEKFGTWNLREFIIIF